MLKRLFFTFTWVSVAITSRISPLAILHRGIIRDENDLRFGGFSFAILRNGYLRYSHSCESGEWNPFPADSIMMRR